MNDERTDFATVSGLVALKTPGGATVPYEDFSVSRMPDRSLVLRAVTRSPHGTILRDVNQLIDERGRDIESVGRLYLNGVLQGTLMRRVEGDRMRSLLWRPDGALDEVEFDWPQRIVLGFHPIMSDAWKMRLVDTAIAEAQPIRVHTVSNSWNGRGLGHGARVGSTARFLGREDITVPAGHFACDLFEWRTSFGDILKIWRHGWAQLLVQMVVERSRKGDRDGTVYQLAQLRAPFESDKHGLVGSVLNHSGITGS